MRWCTVPVSASVWWSSVLATAAYAADPPAQVVFDPLKVPYVSVLFQEEQIAQLAALQEKRKHQKYVGEEKKETDGPAQADAAPVITMFTYPQFYLKSLAYGAPDQWTFWLNQYKFTAGDVVDTGEIRVEEVTPTRVKLRYKASAREAIDFSVPTSDPRVVVDAVARTVVFWVAPNQTFSTYRFKIYEGKIDPMTVQKNTIENTTDTFPADTVADIFQPLPEPPAP